MRRQRRSFKFLALILGLALVAAACGGDDDDDDQGATDTQPEGEAGGDLVDWEGWYWPNHFGDQAAEHLAVRTDVGVWDASPLRKWGFAGPDALTAADRIFTNDMAGLEVGQVRYAPFCDENGKMVGDGTVFKTGEDSCIAGCRA